MLKQKNLSIVIPSLGGSKLENTLNFIHNMKIRPKETIICIPRSYKKNKFTKKDKSKNYNN